MADKKLTKKDFDQRINDLVRLIREKTICFPNDNAEIQIERIRRARKDLIYFLKTYFPHYVTAEFANWHVEELNFAEGCLDSTDASIAAEIWARGFGKTILFGIGLPIWAGFTGKSKFTIFSGADRELSKERTVCLKLECLHNARLRYDFPELALAPDDGEETDFETPDGCRYIALGYKQAIRGRIHGRHRPRLIVIDDLENHNDTNPKIAAKKYQYVTEEAFGALGPKGGIVIWLGNLTNSSSALATFVNKVDQEPANPYIRYRLIKAEDAEGHSTWADAYPDSTLKAKRMVIGKAGYERHYMMKPGIDGDVFQEGWLRFYNPFAGAASANVDRLRQAGFNVNLPTMDELLRSPIVTYCDPSLGSNETNDYKAIVTVAFCGGLYYVLDVKLRRCSLLEMLDLQYELDRRYKTRQFMEQNFWQKVIWQYLPGKAAEKGYMLGITGVESRLNKSERILSLQPMFEWGHIIHCCTGTDWNIFKEQLIGFPNASNDDGPDALAGAIDQFKYLATANQYQTIQPGNRGYMGVF